MVAIRYRNRFRHLLVLLKHYFNSHVMESIQRKLVSILLIVMMVPLVIFLILSINIARGTVESSEISSNISRVDLSGHYIEDQLGEYDQLLFTALVDEMLVPSLTEMGNVSTANILTIQTYIKDKLFQLYDSRASIQAVSLISYENKTLYRIKENEFFVEPYNDSINDIDRRSLIFNADNQENSFSYERNIFRFEDKKLVGKIKINIDYSLFDSIIMNLQSNEGEHVLLLDSSGDILYNPNDINVANFVKRDAADLYNEDSLSKTSVSKEDGTYIFQKKLNQNMILIKLLPEEVMNIGAVHIRQSGTLILIISVMITVLISIYVANRVTKPVIELSDAMEDVQGNNFNVNVNTKRADEIGLLNRRYKEMIYRIRDLIEKDFKREIEKKDAQFLALQAQINPHFLYNTLQVIGGMAIKEDVKEIDDVSQRLSYMFRYITKKTNGLVNVVEEVNHLNNYLYIQQIRFSDKVSMQLFVDEEVNDGLIPLLTIQPLIENCFIHGFDSKVDHCMIKVDIQKIFDEIEIVIEDNGAGISESDLASIQKRLSSGQFVQSESIGLINVNARIKLYFGNEYGIEIISEVNKYTKITITLPYQTKGVDG